MGIPGSVDLGNKSADQVEKGASGIEPGWYRALISDIYLDNHENLKMVFRLPDEREHTETLWNPLLSEKPFRLQQRRDAFSIRIGLVPREAKGTSFDFDWLEAIGREVILNFVRKPNDKGVMFTNLDWMGLFGADDSRVQENVKNQPRLTSMAEATPQAAQRGSAPKQSTISLDDL